jgi:L-ascorbate metabolism protein UlaG (beta-lactamase superfamily)
MALALAALAGTISIMALVEGWKALGKRAGGERLARMERSPEWRDGRFRNPQPLAMDAVGALTGLFHASPHANPAAPLPVERVEPARFATPPATGLRVTWLGHSTLLLELDGHRILTDPVWGERASPVGWAGPARWYPAPLALGDLPAIDAVVISHDHYDHLDYATIRALKDQDTTFVVPLGVGEHLAYWGVPEARIVELDWWERTRVKGLDIVATPARHASGRLGVTGRDRTLWAGFALLGPTHRAFFSGDTGLFPALRDIGDRLGPFDLAMIETGAYGRAWPDWHLGPEQAVTAHLLVRGKMLLPIHWGLFNLAYHGWTEPIERLLAAAAREGAVVATPRPGESVEPGAAPAVARWWPELPWTDAVRDPIVSTGVDPG